MEIVGMRSDLFAPFEGRVYRVRVKGFHLSCSKGLDVSMVKDNLCYRRSDIQL